jgi:hypothetical protein
MTRIHGGTGQRLLALTAARANEALPPTDGEHLLFDELETLAKPRRLALDSPTAASPILASDGETPASSAHRCETTTPHEPRTSLGAGITQSVGARIDRASLLRRIYLDDVLACPCGGRRRVVADITDREVIVAILDPLGLPSIPQPIARARSPALDHA